MINENKYRFLKKELSKAVKEWDLHPLSNSAKSAYLEAKQNMIEYYNELSFPEVKKVVVPE